MKLPADNAERRHGENSRERASNKHGNGNKVWIKVESGKERVRMRPPTRLRIRPTQSLHREQSSHPVEWEVELR